MFQNTGSSGLGGQLGKLGLQGVALLPPGCPRRGTQHARPGSGGSVRDSGLHQPDLIATPIGLHGRVIPGAEVDVTPVGGCALQGGAQLGGLSDVVGFLGITPKLPEGTRKSKGAG